MVAQNDRRVGFLQAEAVLYLEILLSRNLDIGQCNWPAPPISGADVF